MYTHSITLLVISHKRPFSQPWPNFCCRLPRVLESSKTQTNALNETLLALSRQNRATRKGLAGGPDLVIRLHSTWSPLSAISPSRAEMLTALVWPRKLSLCLPQECSARGHLLSAANKLAWPECCPNQVRKSLS
ncbi:unnamed protein product [Protopolystoma xenopodis]|uniref:Uncharacterized protein n=1 Tax=Protopolystoma xenopodis TaxID=117903 RepID=A0A3S5AVL2_9PLAT|nr:unnamed protein product [Protopolystoma xenopodis]